MSRSVRRSPHAASLAILLAAAAAPRSAAQPLYPHAKTFNCNFTRANGTTGTAVVSFQLDGTLGRQTGTLTNRLAGGWVGRPAIELSNPRWEGNKKVWDYRQTGPEGGVVTCRMSTWAHSVAWDSCSNGNRQSCRDATASAEQIAQADALYPFLRINAIFMEDDHETDPLGPNAELELYRAQGQNTLYTAFRFPEAIFDGTTSPPLRNRKPDINDAGRWYLLDPPLDLELDVGGGVLLVEDDDTPGAFKGDPSFTMSFRCFPSASGDPHFVASLPPAISSCQTESFGGNLLSELRGRDDVFQNMLLLTHGADAGLSDTELDIGEWRIRVGFAYRGRPAPQSPGAASGIAVQRR